MLLYNKPLYDIMTLIAGHKIICSIRDVHTSVMDSSPLEKDMCVYLSSQLTPKIVVSL